MMQFLKKYKEAAISALFLIAAVLAEFWAETSMAVYLPLYGISYLAVGGPVWIKAFKSIRRGTVFSEFLLMGIATIGAFAIGEYAEGVAVMLFYMIGEYVQHGAVHRAKSSIKSLINEQPDTALVERNGSAVSMHPAKVNIGEIIQIKPGEKVPLDGELLTEKASFNTAALTGESKPMTQEAGEEVWAGSINQDKPVRVRVTAAFKDSKLSNILTMVQEAAERKAPTQRFISKFAAVYTPAVVWLATAVVLLPYFFVQDYVFQEWFYRALVFLVVSCPCGLVISIPLGYFGGIGAASRNGILFKGSDFLDQLRKMKTLFLDKTGTLTEGTFEVRRIEAVNGFTKDKLLQWAASLEQQSTHPIGKAILDYTNGLALKEVGNQQEIGGRGLKGTIGGKEVLVGNRQLLSEAGIAVGKNGASDASTQVFVAAENKHAGTIYISDKIKEDSREALKNLKDRGVENLIMLSGDNQAVTDAVAKEIGIEEAYGGLLPDQKYARVEQALNARHTVGFVGDGVNDAPVITLADVGLAMGGIGSDATIETADVVIQTDQPSKIATAVDIAHFTHRIVWENIGIALGVKAGVMALAALGYASLWAAIFADVGVALIAIANAVRVQQKFSDDSSLSLFSSVGDEEETSDKPHTCCENC